MTDAHAEIRKALESGPTPGPWRIEPLKYVDGHAIWSGKLGGRDEYRVAGIGGCVPTRDQSEANAALICACHPEAIRALLAERDALEADARRYRVLKDLRAQGLVSVAMLGDYEDMEAGLDAIAASGAGKEGGNG